MPVTDEFPTLEVVQAVCVLWLGFRGFFLARGASELEARVETIAAAIERGERTPARAARREAWLLPFTRTAAALEKGEIGATAARELVSERSARTRRKLSSGAARDLVVCAILVGSLIYARAAALDVSVAFFALGVGAAVLLLATVALRVRIERGLAPASARVAAAIARRADVGKPGGAPTRCRICRETALARVATAEALGKELTELGVVEIFVCPRCGHVAGAARPNGQKPE